MIGVIKFDDIVLYRLCFSILVIIKVIVVGQVVEVLLSENHIAYIIRLITYTKIPFLVPADNATLLQSLVERHIGQIEEN